jgi:transposase
MYTTDLTDAQWELVAPLLPCERQDGRAGRPRRYRNREVVNAILYLVRTGCQWRNLPHDFPPYGSVLRYFRRWRDDGTLERVQGALRVKVRRQAGKEATPSAAIVDSQSVKTTEKGDRRAAGDTTRPSASAGASATSAWTRSA